MKGLRILDNNIDATGMSNEALAVNVLKEYGITPEKLTLIQGGTIKTVWRFASNGAQYCLKRLKQTYDKALFSVSAQIYIKSSGGRVPGIILNSGRQPITEYNGQLFVVYEWVVGNDLDFSVPAEFKKAVQGLASFHIASKGYIPPEQARISSKLSKWPDQYSSMMRKIAGWKETALLGGAQGYYATYAEYADRIVALGELALGILEDSDYLRLTQEGSPSVVLCHQDFGRGNVLEAADGIYVLDLDGVTYDLAARDLRKLIGKNAENTNQWTAADIVGILGWYTMINPLDIEDVKALYADLMFPHWFFGLVKNLFQNGKVLKVAEIERIAKLELSKAELLKSMLERE